MNMWMFDDFSDAPGAPENVQPSDVHADYCKVSWSPPDDDGGAEITGSFLFKICVTIRKVIQQVDKEKYKLFNYLNVKRSYPNVTGDDSDSGHGGSRRTISSSSH